VLVSLKHEYTPGDGHDPLGVDGDGVATQYGMLFPYGSPSHSVPVGQPGSSCSQLPFQSHTSIVDLFAAHRYAPGVLQPRLVRSTGEARAVAARTKMTEVNFILMVGGCRDDVFEIDISGIYES